MKAVLWGLVAGCAGNGGGDSVADPPETGEAAPVPMPEPPSDTGDPPVPLDHEFVEVDGRVVFEAEHPYTQTNDEWTRWYAFVDGEAAPEVACVTNVSCGGGNAPDCNPYPNCDGDDTDPAEASGGTYLEALPDRRRDDDEPGTAGQVGVVNEPGRAAVLSYRVSFTQTGRYYVWVRARGQGPAANGLHVGLDDTWPRNDLVDSSTMRLQFRNGWRWSQARRGGSQHTGVGATDDVNLRDANVWLQIDTPGVHTIRFAMREDGFEMDKVLLTLDPSDEPEDLGPPETRP